MNILCRKCIFMSIFQESGKPTYQNNTFFTKYYIKFRKQALRQLVENASWFGKEENCKVRNFNKFSILPSMKWNLKFSFFSLVESFYFTFFLCYTENKKPFTRTSKNYFMGTFHWRNFQKVKVQLWILETGEKRKLYFI